MYIINLQVIDPLDILTKNKFYWQFIEDCRLIDSPPGQKKIEVGNWIFPGSQLSNLTNQYYRECLLLLEILLVLKHFSVRGKSVFASDMCMCMLTKFQVIALTDTQVTQNIPRKFSWCSNTFILEESQLRHKNVIKFQVISKTDTQDTQKKIPGAQALWYLMEEDTQRTKTTLHSKF